MRRRGSDCAGTSMCLGKFKSREMLELSMENDNQRWWCVEGFENKFWSGWMQNLGRWELDIRLCRGFTRAHLQGVYSKRTLMLLSGRMGKRRLDVL